MLEASLSIWHIAQANLVMLLCELFVELQVGRTPAMGYNTWNDFRCSGINATNVMKVADKMAELKLNTIGYEVRDFATLLPFYRRLLPL